MKIAIYHPWPRSAEAEVAKRYALAAKNLDNVIIKETNNADEVNVFKPDFVLSLSVYSPKAFQFPCYHVANQPFDHYHYDQKDDVFGESILIRGLMTHDGYLTVSKEIARNIADVAYSLNKPFFHELDYCNTVQATEFKEISFENPKLAYFGTNWDQPYGGFRFGDIFDALIQEKAAVKFYGPEKAWKHIPQRFYGGSAEFDGYSVFESYRKCGVGLALNKRDFFKYDLPTSRIFEIIASGALCISDRMPFVERYFGDSVLYVDGGNPQTTAEEIMEHLEWIKKNPQEAAKKAKEAHRIFIEKLSLEKMILRAIEFHKTILEKQYYTKPYQPKKGNPVVSVIMRTGGRDKATVKKSVESVANQSYNNIELILVLYKENLEIRDLAQEYSSRFAKIKIIESFENRGYRSTPICNGLKNVTGDYFGILDDDDYYFPNHISTLLRSFDNPGFMRDVGMVYSGLLDYRADKSYTIEERRQLDNQRRLTDLMVFDHNPSKARLERFGRVKDKRFLNDLITIHPSTFIAKSDLIDDVVLQDPMMKTAEDYYLTLVLRQKCNFLFCCELGSQYNIVFYNSDQSVLDLSREEYIYTRNVILKRLKGAPHSFNWIEDHTEYDKNPLLLEDNPQQIVITHQQGGGGYDYREQTSWRDAIIKLRNKVRKIKSALSYVVFLELCIVGFLLFMYFKVMNVTF